MSTRKANILFLFDTDDHPSSFDRVVAVDAGAQHLFAYGRVTPDDVAGLVHGAMFTRGPDDLKHTAIFIGGGDVDKARELLTQTTQTFFGPMRVSVMIDANGSNTTAAAAVIAAGRHLDLNNTTALVLGGTGPVGQRVGRLLARQGANVQLASRSLTRATEAAAAINAQVGTDQVQPATFSDDQTLNDVQLVIAAGAAGVQLLGESHWRQASGLKVLIDLNAVPPAGIESVDAMDKARERHGVICYGAIGVGGTKMKIHKAAIASLFESNDKVLDAEEIHALGLALDQAG